MIDFYYLWLCLPLKSNVQSTYSTRSGVKRSQDHHQRRKHHHPHPRKPSYHLQYYRSKYPSQVLAYRSIEVDASQHTQLLPRSKQAVKPSLSDKQEKERFTVYPADYVIATHSSTFKVYVSSRIQTNQHIPLKSSHQKRRKDAS